MKKSLVLLIVGSMLFSSVGCSQGTTEITQSPTVVEVTETEISETTETTEEFIDDPAWDTLASLGNVQTENGIMYVDVTLPASFFEGTTITQEDLDSADNSHYTSATLNDDGSITYRMTRSQHKVMLDEIVQSMNDSLQAVVDNPDNAITAITHTDDFTSYDIYLSTEEIGLTEGFMAYGFFMISGYYAVFSGVSMDDIVLNYYNCNGDLVGETHAADLVTEE